MKTFFLRFFTWWNGQTFGTQLWTWRFGESVGTDEFGNRYYRTKGGKIDPVLLMERRWVIYNGVAEASSVPPSWHGWLHHTVDVPPTEEKYQPRPWQKPHQPNLTRTPSGASADRDRRWRRGAGRRRRATTRLGIRGAGSFAGNAGASRPFPAAFPVLTGRSMARSTIRALLTVAGLLAACAGIPRNFPTSSTVCSAIRRRCRRRMYLIGRPYGRPGSRNTFRSQQTGLPPGPPPGQRGIRTPSRCRRHRALPAPRRPPSTQPGAAPNLPGPQQRRARHRRRQRPSSSRRRTRCPTRTAEFAGIDKITGRIISFDVIYRRDGAVRRLAGDAARLLAPWPPTEEAKTDGFVEVDETHTCRARSAAPSPAGCLPKAPGLNAVEHAAL